MVELRCENARNSSVPCQKRKKNYKYIQKNMRKNNSLERLRRMISRPVVDHLHRLIGAKKKINNLKCIFVVVVVISYVQLLTNSSLDNLLTISPKKQKQIYFFSTKSNQ